MIETPPKMSPRDVRFPPAKEEPIPAGTPIAVRAAVLVLAIIAIALGAAVYRLNSAVAKGKVQLAKTDSEASQVKADLAKVNAQAADLSAQLDKAKTARSDLQAQLDKAQARQSDLQSQLEKARADLLSQADKAKAQVSEMQAAFQAKINSANDESSRLRRELDEAKRQSGELKSQLARAQDELAKLQPLAVKARALPVETTLEKDFWARGFTMHVRNLNTDPLKVKITIGGSAKASVQSATIEGGGLLNVENLPAGAKLVIESAGYNTLSVTAQ
jgi:predicted  nucleic acid-binding Zn-ribbon protein